MRKITDNIYVNLLNRDQVPRRGCNSSFVITSEGIVVIDTPLLPTDALRWRDEIAKRGEVRYIINTEHHRDHIIGNYFLPGTVVSSCATRAAFGEILRMPDFHQRLKEWDPEGINLLKNYQRRLPIIAFSDRLDIYLGDRTFKLIHMPGYIPGQVVVFVPQEKVLFAGGNFVNGSQSSLAECCPLEWIELLEKIEAMDVDIVRPGHGEIGDKLEPALALPEVVDPNKMWWNGKFPWIDSDRKIVSFVAMASAPIAINTDLVKPGEIKSYRDLINPKWKGKMMMDDPIIAGKGQQLSVIAESITGWDFLSELAKQEPIVMRDRRLHAEWLARGKYPISIQPDTTSTNEFIRVGAPVAFLMPVEGTYLSGACFDLMNRATHPNAARVFVNWVLTKEAGTLMSKATGQQSARVDVPTDFLEPVTVRQPGVNYVIGYDEANTLRQEQGQNKLNELFRPLLK